MPSSEPPLPRPAPPDGESERTWCRWEFPPPFFSLKPPPADLALGHTLSEFRVSNFTRVPAIAAAAIIVLLWLVMTVGGFLYALKGEVAVYDILLSLVPVTLLAAGTVYFALAVSRGLIRVGDKGIVFRTALKLYWMPYRDIASAKLVKRWAEVRGREVDAGYDLVLTPVDPTEKPVTVKRLFGRHDNQLIQAVEQWQRYDEQRLANQHLSDGPTGAMRLAIDNHWNEAETADPVPPDN